MRPFNLSNMIRNHNPKRDSRMSQIKILLTLFILLNTSCLFAHHPHDMVDAMAVSPTYITDKTIYVANAERLFKSGNGGSSWKELVNGLDHTHHISSIEIPDSSAESDTVFIATLGDGVYRSTNGGVSWNKTNVGLHNLEIKHLTARSQGVILALDTAGQLHTSKDNGNSWLNAVTPENTAITSISQQTQFIDNKILAGDSQGRVLSSTDSGVHWMTIAHLPVKTTVTEIVIDPSDTSGSAYFLGTRDNGLYKTSDNGASFQQLNNGLQPKNIVSLALSRNFSRNHTMIATTWREAVFISTDGGGSWNKYDAGLSTDKQADTPAYQSPHFRQAIIVSDDNQTVFLAAYTGLFKSDNGGQAWDEIETLPVSLITGMAVSPSVNGRQSIAISTYGGGSYVSDDKGRSWTIGNKGLNTTRLMEIEFSPSFQEDHTLFSGSIGRLLKSTDGGDSWEQINVRYDSMLKKLIYKLRSFGINGLQYLSKQEKSLVYPTVFSPSPDYASDKTLFFGTRWHGMYSSDEHGQNAQNIWGNTNGAVTSLSLSPDFPADHTIFTYIREDGIFKSSDSGDTWHKVVEGLPNMQSEHGDFSVVFSPVYSSDKTLYASGPTGLFLSADQGESWNAVDVGAFGSAPNVLSLGISPNYANDHTLLISLKGHGLYRSVDSGQHFVKAGEALIKNNHSLERIRFSSDFVNDHTIYAASHRNIFRSSDSGDNWTLLHRPVRYEDRRDVIQYEGNWIEEKNDEYSASTIHYSDNQGDKTTLKFFGCGIRWITTKSPQGGIANVYIDNSVVDSIDLYSDQLEAMSAVFTKTDLACKPHTITIEVGKRQKRESAKRRVMIDAFDVLPNDSVTKITPWQHQ